MTNFKWKNKLNAFNTEDENQLYQRESRLHEPRINNKYVYISRGESETSPSAPLHIYLVTFRSHP